MLMSHVHMRCICDTCISSWWDHLIMSIYAYVVDTHFLYVHLYICIHVGIYIHIWTWWVDLIMKICICRGYTWRCAHVTCAHEVHMWHMHIFMMRSSHHVHICICRGYTWRYAHVTCAHDVHLSRHVQTCMNDLISSCVDIYECLCRHVWMIWSHHS